jgi:serine phosphatase RsbU (regulator of sigma subunit)
MFGMEALKDWLLNCQSYHLTDSLIEELKRFSHGKPASDDISVMSVRIGEAV